MSEFRAAREHLHALLEPLPRAVHHDRGLFRLDVPPRDPAEQLPGGVLRGNDVRRELLQGIEIASPRERGGELLPADVRRDRFLTRGHDVPGERALHPAIALARERGELAQERVDAVVRRHLGMTRLVSIAPTFFDSQR